jgi:hypothetical protein
MQKLLEEKDNEISLHLQTAQSLRNQLHLLQSQFFFNTQGMFN